MNEWLIYQINRMHDEGEKEGRMELNGWMSACLKVHMQINTHKYHKTV